MVLPTPTPTSAHDEVLIASDWAGLTVVSRSASSTPEDIRMPATGVGVSFVGDRRSKWRFGRGATRTSVLASGSVFVFSGEEFVWAENSNPYAGIALDVDDSVMARTADRAGLPSSRIELCPSYFTRDDTLLALAVLMDREIREQGPGGHLYRDSLATAALSHLLRFYTQSAHRNVRTPPALSPAALASVAALMRDGMAEPLRLTDLAAEAHMSPFHFARSFRLATGESPHRYLTRLRLQRARSLLTTTDIPIGQVARSVGFSSAAHFSTLFRRHVGLSPSAFRAL